MFSSVTVGGIEYPSCFVVNFLVEISKIKREGYSFNGAAFFLLPNQFLAGGLLNGVFALGKNRILGDSGFF